MQNFTDTIKYKTNCYCILCTYVDSLRGVSREIINTTVLLCICFMIYVACFTICIVCFVLLNCYFQLPHGEIYNKNWKIRRFHTESHTPNKWQYTIQQVPHARQLQLIQNIIDTIKCPQKLIMFYDSRTEFQGVSFVIKITKIWSR